MNKFDDDGVVGLCGSLAAGFANVLDRAGLSKDDPGKLIGEEGRFKIAATRSVVKCDLHEGCVHKNARDTWRVDVLHVLNKHGPIGYIYSAHDVIGVGGVIMVGLAKKYSNDAYGFFLCCEGDDYKSALYDFLAAIDEPEEPAFKTSKQCVGHGDDAKAVEDSMYAFDDVSDAQVWINRGSVYYAVYMRDGTVLADAFHVCAGYSVENVAAEIVAEISEYWGELE